MKGLIRKDIELLKGNARVFAGVYLIAFIFLFSMDNGGQFFMCYLAMISSMLVINTISYDDFENGMSFLMTLPITRSTYVKEKYLFGGLFGLGGWVLGVIAATLVTFWKEPAADWRVWLAVCAVAIGLFCVFLILMIPAQLKFGSENSRIVLIAIVVGILIAGYAIVKAIKWLGVDLAVLGERMGAIGMPALIGILVVFLALCMAGSYRISIRVVNNREF